MVEFVEPSTDAGVASTTWNYTTRTLVVVTDSSTSIAQGSQVVRLEMELVDLDASALALLAHPAPSLRSAALGLASAVRALFDARKGAYDRAVSERLAVVESSRVEASAESERELAELRTRIARSEQVCS